MSFNGARDSGSSKSAPVWVGTHAFSQTPLGKNKKAVRSGDGESTCSCADASDANKGVANATPLPRKKRRRETALGLEVARWGEGVIGINRFRVKQRSKSLFSSFVNAVVSVLEWIASHNGFNDGRCTVIIGFELFQRIFHDAIIELVQLSSKGKT